MGDSTDSRIATAAVTIRESFFVICDETFSGIEPLLDYKSYPWLQFRWYFILSESLPRQRSSIG
jgi:hypothetical protein